MIELNDNNFKQELKDRKLVLVDFYATWCGPCSMQSEVLNKIGNSRSLEFDIVKVNVDEAPQTAMEYGITSIPTLMVFKDNKLINRCIGYQTEDEILKMIEEAQN